MRNEGVGGFIFGGLWRCRVSCILQKVGWPVREVERVAQEAMKPFGEKGCDSGKTQVSTSGGLASRCDQRGKDNNSKGSLKWPECRRDRRKGAAQLHGKIRIAMGRVEKDLQEQTITVANVGISNFEPLGIGCLMSL